MAKADGKFIRRSRLVTRPDGSQFWQWIEDLPVPVKKLSGKVWVPVAYARRPAELLAMGIAAAGRALAEEAKTAPDCAKRLEARYIEKQLRELGVFPRAHRGSPKQRPK